MKKLILIIAILLIAGISKSQPVGTYPQMAQVFTTDSVYFSTGDSVKTLFFGYTATKNYLIIRNPSASADTFAVTMLIAKKRNTVTRVTDTTAIGGFQTGTSTTLVTSTFIVGATTTNMWKIDCEFVYALRIRRTDVFATGNVDWAYGLIGDIE